MSRPAHFSPARQPSWWQRVHHSSHRALTSSRQHPWWQRCRRRLALHSSGSGPSHVSPRRTSVLRDRASCRRPTCSSRSTSWPCTIRWLRTRTTRSGTCSRALTGGSSYFYQFCPAVSSVKAARRFGVTYILEPQDARGPAGSDFVEAVGDEELYRVPGAASATIVPAHSGRVLAFGRRSGNAGHGPPPQPGDVEARHRCRHAPGAPVARHRRSRMARHDRRSSARPPAILRVHAASADSPWSSQYYHRLLANGLLPRPRLGRL